MEIPRDLQLAFEALCRAQMRCTDVKAASATEDEIVAAMTAAELARLKFDQQLDKLGMQRR